MAIDDSGDRRYYDDRETIPQTEREGYQLRKLLETMEQAYRYSSTARNLMDFIGMGPSDFDSLDDLLKPGPTGTNVDDLNFLFTI